tara:strand:+ start:350 stop:667 length:318 start_codon:yes stop_codon:yes gene_type:complete
MNILNIRELVAFKSEKLNKVSIFDTDRFFCDVYCLQPGQSQKIHSHESSDKVYFILEGKAKVTVGKEERELKPYEITIATAGEPHGVVNGSDENLVMLVFMAPKP